MNATLAKTQALLTCLGHDEEPMGVLYADSPPEKGFAPPEV